MTRTTALSLQQINTRTAASLLRTADRLARSFNEDFTGTDDGSALRRYSRLVEEAYAAHARATYYAAQGN